MTSRNLELAKADELVELLDDDDVQLVTDMIEAETDLFEIMTWLLNKMGEDEASVAALKTYRGDLEIRQKRLEARVAKGREWLAGALDTLGMKKLELPVATLSMRMGNPKLVIESEDVLDKYYFDYVPKLNRARLTEDATKDTVLGVHMSNAEPILTIRRK